MSHETQSFKKIYVQKNILDENNLQWESLPFLPLGVI